MKISLGEGQPLFNCPKGARLQKHLHFNKETMKYEGIVSPPNSPYIQEYFSTASALLKITLYGESVGMMYSCTPH